MIDSRHGVIPPLPQAGLVGGEAIPNHEVRVTLPTNQTVYETFTRATHAVKAGYNRQPVNRINEVRHPPLEPSLTHQRKTERE